MIASLFGPLWKRLQPYIVHPFRNWECIHIRSPVSITLQTYSVPFLTEIASILSPNRPFHCKHIWSLSLKLLLPYVFQLYTRSHVSSTQLSCFAEFGYTFLEQSPLKLKIYVVQWLTFPTSHHLTHLDNVARLYSCPTEIVRFGTNVLHAGNNHGDDREKCVCRYGI